jgi:uroporphyrinogen-III synthase
VRLIVTRPEPDGARTATKLRALGHDVELVPLLRIEPVHDVDLEGGPFAAVLITSANALSGIASHERLAELQSLPVFVVGRRTAEATRAAGFPDVISADGNQRDLVRLVRARMAAVERKPLLYLAGEDRSGDLAGELAALGLPVRTVVVYRAVPVFDFPDAIRNALTLGRIDGVLHFSRRTAESFLRCASAGEALRPALNVTHYCLSPQVAEPLVAAGAAVVRVATWPEEAALIELVNAVVVGSRDGRINQNADER